MSLLVWLPMTKDLSDQGLGGCTITNDGATLDNNGKLGKCYNFDGTNDRILVSGLNKPKDITIAFWLKRNATTNTRQFLFTAWSGVSIELTTTNTIFGKVTFSSGEGGSASGGTITADTGWVHVCYTFEDGVGGKIYINGQLKASGDTTNSINWGSTTSGYIGNYSNIYLNGKLNDFRIYNHALSPREIEILSRGLVCHYPLCGNGRSGDNLLPYTAVNTANQALLATNYSSTWSAMTIETIDGYACYKYPKDKSSTWFATGRWGGYLKANTTYTYSAWIYFTASSSTSFNFTSLGHFQVYNSNSTASDKAHEDVAEARIYEPSTIPKNTWTKIRITFTTNSLANSVFQVYPRYNIGANVGDLYFRDMKLEETDHVTPWMPNSADTEYTAMGYNSTTEYDVSGYGNNMTKTGTITYTSDSARYSVASHFINGSYIIATKNCPDYLPTDGVTVNLWVKPTTWANPISCTESGGWNFEGSTIQFVCYISGVGYKAAVSGVTGASLQDGKWHMLTGTYDRIAQEVKIYVDGILKTTTATGSSNSIGYASNRLVISGEAGGGTPASSAFVGEESDVRIYATALSATQVAELYNTAVSVANNGTLMGYELVEG